MNFDLTDEQRDIQNLTREFAKRELAPVAAKLDREGDRQTFLGNLRQLAQLGLMGINVSADYGGAEAGVVAFSLAITEIARACAATAVTMSVNNMVCEVIQAIGAEEQKRRYIPRICSGEYPAGGFALTEPEQDPTPERFAPPRCSMAASGCSAEPRYSSPAANMRAYSWCGP